MGVDAINLKEKYDMRDVVQKSLGPPIHTERKHSTWPCPFHNETSVGAFKVFADGYHCFSCKKQGDIFTWYQEVEQISFKETLSLLNGGQMPEGNWSQEEIEQAKRERAKREMEKLEEQLERAQDAVEQLRKEHKWTEYHEMLDPISRDLWRKRGITDDYWMDFWQLGFNPKYTIHQKQSGVWSAVHTSPSLTIPVWGHGSKVNNIKHRLLDPGEYAKYMQEKSGVKAQSFVAEPTFSGKDALVVEGEIKAMVAFLTYDDPNMQVFGLPSATPDDYALNELKDYDNLTIILDPDTYEKKNGERAPITSLIEKLGRERVRHLRLPDKVDDMIVNYGLDKTWLRSVVASARPV